MKQTVVGDLDSFSGLDPEDEPTINVVYALDQDKTDFQKGFEFFLAGHG